MKKIALIILISSCLIIFCSSCSEETITDDKKSTDNQETEDIITEDTEIIEYTSPNVNYENEEFTIAAIDYITSGTKGVWSASGYCDAFAIEQNGDALNDAIYIRNQRVSEELGIDIKIHSLASFSEGGEQLRKIILSGDDIVDLAYMNASRLPLFFGTDYIIDLNTLPFVDFSHSWWDQNSIDELNLYDTLYAVTGDISLNINFAPITYFFNKTLVEDYQLGNLYDLVDSGNWTLNKTVEMCIIVANDLNGDGVRGIEDSFGMLCESAGLVYMVRAGGSKLTEKNSEGTPTIAVNTERTVSLVELCVPFMNDRETNILAGNYTGYSNTFFELMLPMFIDNRALFYNNQLLVALDLRNMDADFGILPPPKFDENQGDYYCPISDWWGTFMIVPTTNSKPELTGYVLEAMGYYSQQYVTSAYIETTVKTKTLRDDESARMVEIIMANRVYDLGSFFDWGSINSMFTTLASSNNSNFSSEFAKITDKVQTAIDTTVELLKK